MDLGGTCFSRAAPSFTQIKSLERHTAERGSLSNAVMYVCMYVHNMYMFPQLGFLMKQSGAVHRITRTGLRR